jgi:glucan phosphoethanolaminetransferase (alkaline phosphatase superfamily)
MFDEFRDFIGMGLSQVDLAGFVVFIIFAVLFGLLSYRYCILTTPKKRMRKIDVILSVCAILALSLVFNNNVRMNPGAFNPLVNLSFSFTKAAEGFAKGKGVGLRTLTEANRDAPEELGEDLGFNVVLILHESLRADRCNTHGYALDTTPNQSAFITAEDGVVFHNAYAASTRTMLAVPSFFTGVSPVQSGSLIFIQPIISNYLNMFRDITTFLIAAHSYRWGNFDKFIDDGSWDYIFYKEIGNYPSVSELSIDDKYVVIEFDKFLSGVEGQFGGVLHFAGTHSPYQSVKEDQIFNGRETHSDYDNSVRTLDRNVGAVLDLLKKRNLLENTVLLSTSDHAEALGEHGYWGHLHTFYDEEARVPLWLYIPKGLRSVGRFARMYERAANNVQRNVSNTDIVPTMLDIVGLWGRDDIAVYQDRLLGRPLTADLEEERCIMFQNKNSVSTENMFTGLGIRCGKYKYLLHSRHGKLAEEVYDLIADPNEEANLVNAISTDFLEGFRKQVRSHKNSRELYEDFMRGRAAL